MAILQLPPAVRRAGAAGADRRVPPAGARAEARLLAARRHQPAALRDQAHGPGPRRTRSARTRPGARRCSASWARRRPTSKTWPAASAGPSAASTRRWAWATSSSTPTTRCTPTRTTRTTRIDEDDGRTDERTPATLGRRLPADRPAHPRACRSSTARATSPSGSARSCSRARTTAWRCRCRRRSRTTSRRPSSGCRPSPSSSSATRTTATSEAGFSYVPIDPCQGVIAALRVALGERIAAGVHRPGDAPVRAAHGASSPTPTP